MRIINAARMEWLEQRRKGLGGSDIAAIAGLSPYGSPWSVYWDKVNPVLDDGQSEAARWGTILEATIAAEWASLHGLEVIKPGTIVGAEEWQRGNPDGLVARLPRAGDDPVHVLEVKQAGEWAWAQQWDGGAVVPAWYEAQCQWYLMLTGAPRAHFAVLVGGNRLEDSSTRPALRVERNDRAIALLVDLGRRFWHDHVVARVAPPPDASRAARAKLDELYPAPADRVAVDLDLERDDELAERVLDAVTAYRQHRAEVKRRETLRDAAGHLLIKYLGERGATDLVVGDDPVVTYRPTRRLELDALLDSLTDVEAVEAKRAALREEWDTKALERLLGRKRVDQYRKPDPARRTLRVTDLDEE